MVPTARPSCAFTKVTSSTCCRRTTVVGCGAVRPTQNRRHGVALETRKRRAGGGPLWTELAARQTQRARTVAEACLEQERHMRVELAHVSSQQGAVSDELHRELCRVAGDASRFRHMAAVGETQVRHQHLRWV